MNARHSKRQRDIKSKLMAAIAMLLVSSIMMVSSTYAWFTLSTAPEVTGINTAVGANGNLEMALQPLDGDSSKITSSTADSMAVKPVTESNITWGNLVKLDNAYGLENIALYPSALNETGGKIGTSFLKTPEYGADGRISRLQANTYTGVYTNNAFFEKAAEGQTVIETPYGVRAVGTKSGMTPRNLDFRQALSNANTAASQAKSAASTSLNANGSTLADVAITHALADEGADTYNDTDLQAMKNVVNDLLGTAGKTGSLQYIETALKQYIVAASIAPGTTETTYTEIKARVEAATLDQLAAGSVEGAVLPTGFGGDTGYIAKLNAAIANVQNAKTTLNGLSGNSYSWEQISPALNKLVNTSGLLINGNTVSHVMANKGDLASSIMKNGLILTMGTGSGVFSEIADFCGDYSAGIIIPELAYGNLVVPDVEATMNTQAINPTHLASANTAVKDTFVSATGNGGESPLTDYYGYIVDLAFRTNAADSYLQIQPTAVDRIYSDGSNTNTMGHGATMSFKSVDTANFTTAAVTRLMGAIRIVFFNSNAADQSIITYARLDTAKATTETDGTVTMPIFLCAADGTAKTNTVADTNDNGVDESVAIMELKQNEIHELSVLVYLDGEAVGNDDVAVADSKSMTGSMNLQFSSSATLVAMDYSDLKSGNGGALDNNGGDDEDDDTPTVTTLTVDSVTGGTAESATATYGTYLGNGGVCAVIKDAQGTEITTGTVTINGTGATYNATAGGWIAVIATQPASVTIVVS